MGRKKTNADARETLNRQLGQYVTIMDCVIQTGKDPQGNEMTPARMKCLDMAMNRLIPVVSAQEIQQEVKTSYLVQVPTQALDNAEWEQNAAAITACKEEGIKDTKH